MSFIPPSLSRAETCLSLHVILVQDTSRGFYIVNSNSLRGKSFLLLCIDCMELQQMAAAVPVEKKSKKDAVEEKKSVKIERERENRRRTCEAGLDWRLKTGWRLKSRKKKVCRRNRKEDNLRSERQEEFIDEVKSHTKKKILEKKMITEVDNDEDVANDVCGWWWEKRKTKQTIQRFQMYSFSWWFKSISV